MRSDPTTQVVGDFSRWVEEWVKGLGEETRWVGVWMKERVEGLGEETHMMSSRPRSFRRNLAFMS